MTDLPDRGKPSEITPSRRLSNRDFELVIRRAAELQARDVEDSESDGIDEAEALRIGRELGLSTQYLHRALVEVTGDATSEEGLLVKLYGPLHLSAGRTVRGTSDEVSRTLQSYLEQREFLVVLRRMGDRTIYTRATGLVAGLGRGWSQVVNRSPLLEVAELEVVVHRLEDGFVYVNVSTQLRKERTGTAAGSIIGGSFGTLAAAGPLAALVAPPAALLALPILAGSVWIGRAHYKGVREKVQVQLESLLDRLEHGELMPQDRPRPVLDLPKLPRL